MHSRIQHIVLSLATTALLSGGCVHPDVPAQDGAEIRFSAGAVQLEDDTRSVTTLDQRTSFEPADQISVYAWHLQESAKIFDAQTVTCPNPANGIWSYSQKKKWRWQDNDYYDFLAVPKTVGGVTVPVSGVTSVPPTTSSSFSLSVPYDARTDDYDLLMAGTRRRVTDVDPSAVVELNFQHILSAVRVLFYRDSGSQKFVITSFRFKDLIVAANLIWGWDESAKKCLLRLDNTEHTHQELFGEDRNSAAPWLETAKFVDLYNPGFYDLLIPQNLDTDDAPSLVIKLRDDVNNAWNLYEPEPIPLKDITIKGTDTPITRWEPGHVYTYEVHILLNGGVLVNVITTQWEDIDAYTPGLML